MKKILTLLIAVVSIATLSSCSSWFDDCGPFDEGYTWEKKDHVFMVPYYHDSLGGDSLSIRVYYLSDGIEPEIVYSSSLDSFKITTDIRGSYFYSDGADSLWKPYYDYEWGYETLYLGYSVFEYTPAKQFSQTPQCSPPVNDIDVQKIRVEVPKNIRVITLRNW